MIHATPPQAKGRIERLFGTLQDRLVKEMRLAGVGTMEEANRFLDGYLLRRHGRVFAIQNPTLGMRPRPAQVFEQRDGREVLLREITPGERLSLPVQEKAAEKLKPGKHIPPTDHPWRRSNRIIHRSWDQEIF
jgi:hypothetical protein